MEQSVLGGLLLDNQAWDRVSERVVEQDFTPATSSDFPVYGQTGRKSRPIDLITLQEELEQHEQLDAVGGFGLPR